MALSRMSLRSVLVAALAALAVATPVPENSLQERQLMSSNDVEDGVCRDVTFIFARGSTEQGNMVRLHPRPPTMNEERLIN